MTRDDALRRVRALIRLADSTTFPEEAKNARRKAGYLMAQHRIVYPRDVAGPVIPKPAPRPPPPPPEPPPVESWPTTAWGTVGTENTGYTVIRVVTVTINGTTYQFRHGS